MFSTASRIDYNCDKQTITEEGNYHAQIGLQRKWYRKKPERPPIRYEYPLSKRCKCMKKGGSSYKSAFSEPILPPRVIASEYGVIIYHNYRSNDHGPAHVHVRGRGKETRVQQNGYPMKGDPELSTVQRQVVRKHRAKIRRAVDKIYRWLKYYEIIEISE